MSARRYLLLLGATIIGLALLSITFTILVDPYRMYGTPVVAGWTALKPRIYEQVGIAKTRQLERERPTTVLLGNSRTEIGLNPESPFWPADARPVFNAAEAGKDLFTAWRMLQEAIAVRPPKTVVLGLDIYDFLFTSDSTADALPPIGADERRLLVKRDGTPNPTRPLQLWQDRFATTLTIDALADSLETVFDQNDQTSTTMTLAGFNPLHEYRLFVARSGYHELFAQKNAIYEAQYRRYLKSDFADPAANEGFRDLARILGTITTRHISLILYIHPYHADYLEMLHHAGLWESFEAWKRTIVHVVAKANQAAPAVPIRLIDFSGYDAYSTEAVPPAGDRRSSMRWYWEPGHYKAALGDRILARLFSSPQDEGAASWGRDLGPATVEADLAAIRRDREAYLKPLAGAR